MTGAKIKIILKKNNSRRQHYYVLIQLTYINFVKSYLTNFWNKRKTLTNLSHSVAILMTCSIEEIDESKAGAKVRRYRSRGHASCEWGLIIIILYNAPTTPGRHGYWLIDNNIYRTSVVAPNVGPVSHFVYRRQATANSAMLWYVTRGCARIQDK